MLPQVAGPASTGPDAYLVAPPSGLTDELRWEGSAARTLRALAGCLGHACLATAEEPNAALPLIGWLDGSWDQGSRRRFPAAFAGKGFLERGVPASSQDRRG